MKSHQLYKDSDNSLIETNYVEMNISKEYIGTRVSFHLTLGDEVDNDCFIDIISNNTNSEKSSKNISKNLILICKIHIISFIKRYLQCWIRRPI